jgi:hypothetical protein
MIVLIFVFAREENLTVDRSPAEVIALICDCD